MNYEKNESVTISLERYDYLALSLKELELVSIKLSELGYKVYHHPRSGITEIVTKEDHDKLVNDFHQKIKDELNLNNK